MDLNKITKKIIGCGIEVHRELGAGLLESIYESALCIELKPRLKIWTAKSTPS